jgi:hypothetical protein
VPEASQIAVTPGAASLTDGFPPLNFLSYLAGGVPPFGNDMNGILNQVTAWLRWTEAGGVPRYNSAYQTAIGGYPNGALLRSADGSGWFLSTADDNMTDPETGGADWTSYFTTGSTAVTMTSADVTLTAFQYGKPTIIVTGLLTANLNLIFPNIAAEWVVVNNTTGAFSITAKTAAGTGVPVDDTAQKIMCDAVNVYSPVSYAPTVKSAYSNLKASADGVSADVVVSADEIVVESASNGYQTLRTVALTIAGTAVGANGIDAGAIAASTWYSLWVIWNGTTTAGLMSLSATAPTLPAGYTHKTRVGWIRTDGSGDAFPLSFKQAGSRVQYVVAAGSNVAALPPISAGAAGSLGTPTWATIALAGFVPPTAVVGEFTASLGGSLGSLMAAPNASYGAYDSVTNPPPVILGQGVGGTYNAVRFGFVLESLNLYVAAGVASNLFQIVGWEDEL